MLCAFSRNSAMAKLHRNTIRLITSLASSWSHQWLILCLLDESVHNLYGNMCADKRIILEQSKMSRSPCCPVCRIEGSCYSGQQKRKDPGLGANKSVLASTCQPVNFDAVQRSKLRSTTINWQSRPFEKPPQGLVPCFCFKTVLASCSPVCN